MSVPAVQLRGSTWRHVRGLAPLAAAGQAWADGSGIEVQWETHSAKQFGEGPLEPLARAYDLVCFDHPLTGDAAARGLFLPLDEFLPAEFLADLAAHGAGPSYRSYGHDGHQWGLPIDAASIASAARPDRLAALGETVPATWDELLSLARRRPGAVVQGFSRLTCTAMLFTFCANLGAPAFAGGAGGFGAGDILREAFARLETLFTVTDGAERLAHGSIQVLRDAASDAGQVAYVPFCYGYSTFTRPGFVPHPLTFHPFASLGSEPLAGGVVGGVGLAVSAFSPHRAEALALAQWIASPGCQRTIYAACGGQPADRRAWEDDFPNGLTGNFYRTLLPGLDAGWLRPTMPAFHHFQNHAAEILHGFLLKQRTLPETALALESAAGPTVTHA